MIENNPIQYDEEDAVRFIQHHLPQEIKGKYTDDEVNYIIDIIYEYYEEKGIMDVEDDAAIEIDEDELIAYVTESVKKDKLRHFEDDDIVSIIQGELTYCESVGIFED